MPSPGESPEPLGASTLVAERLRDRIFAGALIPGRPLKEAQVAGELGVSRTTVREAIRRLELEGLVRHERNRGGVVRAPSASDVLDLYAARHVIEVGAAFSGAPGQAASSIRTAYDDLVVALDSGDSASVIVADLAFHKAVVHSAGSDRLNSAFDSLANELRLYLTILSNAADEYQDAPSIATEHEVIVEAFEDLDHYRAAQLLSGHIRSDAERLAVIVSE
ncbi:GntR family transcriptional regulator [Nocardia pseudovaccinii]|uniref:GntR family transcriptional regulator n=1 Tax=Nocardia pseudovaccinii TaxID=189540 RepID=UPI003D94DE5F